MKNHKCFALIIFLAFTVNCIKITPHSTDKAIDSCNKFIRALIVEDYDVAYDCISDRLKEDVSKEQFVRDLKYSREKLGNFDKVIFDSYAFVPGQRAIELFYIFQQEISGDVEWHFVLEGDSKTRYELFFLDIGNRHRYPEDIKYIKAPPRLKLNREVVVTGE
jgi:hypothetical protein